jgi:hypothetical protein
LLSTEKCRQLNLHVLGIDVRLVATLLRRRLQQRRVVRKMAGTRKRSGAKEGSDGSRKPQDAQTQAQ